VPTNLWFPLRRPTTAWAFRGAVVASFAVALGAWWWLSHRPWMNPVFVPPPRGVWDAAWPMLTDGSANLWLDVRASFLRVAGGFLLSAALAVPVGVLIGSFHLGEGFFQPLTEFVRYVPVPALTPVLMILFGIDELSKVMLIFAGTYFQLVLMVADEIRRVPRELVEVSSTLGAGRAQNIRRVLLPAALPGMFDAFRVCHGWAWTWLVVAELIAAEEGLGYRILKFSRFLQTPKIWFYLLLLGTIGLVLDLAFRACNRRLFPWAKPMGGATT
jgi:NitT/TauT family transport system permease protein